VLVCRAALSSLMTGSPACRAGFLATLSCLAILLAGCGGGTSGGGTTTPAPAPTPAPTPGPTPAPSWKAICTWKDGNTTIVQEAACDDSARKVVTASVSTNRVGPIQLGSLEDCAKAFQDFHQGNCGQHGTFKQQSDTEATCVTSQAHDTTLVQTIDCDNQNKTKIFTYQTTVPGEGPYGKGKGCDFMIASWMQGQENAHQNACFKVTTSTTTTRSTNRTTTTTKPEKTRYEIV